MPKKNNISSKEYWEKREDYKLKKGLKDLKKIEKELVEEYKKKPTVVDNMIVYDDGIIKGVINRISKDDAVEICEFYVEPFFKGNGIGKELIQQVILEARTSKKNRIFLWVIEDNLSARKFYENNGFIASGETCLIEGTTKTDMCYEMIL